MTIRPHVPKPAPADLLRFACGHCGSSLEVPGSFAGVRAPCPVCAAEIAAPDLPAWDAASAAQLFAKPPPGRRELPPPLAPVAENRPVRPIPIIEEKPAVNTASAPLFQDRPPPKRLAAVPPSGAQKPQENAPHFPAGKRGIFEDSPAGSDHELHAKPRPVTFRRRGWQRWLDITVVGVFCGLGIACLAALRFAEPRTTKATPGLPEDLTQRVAEETRMERLRCHEAEELALAAVSRYLGAASEPAAASHLMPPPEGLSLPAFPPFTAQLPTAWKVKSSRRLAGTDRYLAVVKPEDADGPVFVVEQTESGPRLHSGAITQQSAGLFQKFSASPGEGEGTFYAEARPSQPDNERDYRRGRPDLAEFRFVDIATAFPTDALPLIACLKPGSEAARQFARRSHDPSWRPALVQVRWQRHRESGPYVEVVRFLPGSWSGEPSLPPVSATTASTSP